MDLWPAFSEPLRPLNRWQRWVRNIRETPSAVLLFGQIALLFVYPYIETATLGHYAKAAIGAAALVVIFLAVRVARATPALTWVAAVLGVPVVLLTVAEAVWQDIVPLAFVSALLHALFYFYIAYALIRYMFADNWVTRDELFATGATFTVVVWAYAYVYQTVQFIWPNSFTIHGGELPGTRSWFELLYLSVTTMTNTGLSDIVAVTPHVRSFVMLQMLSGILYVALVVARLVGLTIMRFNR
ncbi:MAG: potassium channel family protein [Intrasporangium sp.]|uniref:potassium channel family protein n=1 Tax=Intrasporangium sp. TaxID=1925024 RepID=UPI002647FF8C|nr:potassium channel family protein [Intrasporangium sp.]MDN5794250.1 potassium channel family protein [Intrasporangium sp.]